MIFSSLYKKISETTKKIVKATPKILFYSYIFASIATIIPEIGSICLIGATSYFMYKDYKNYLFPKQECENFKRVNVVLVNNGHFY